MRARHGGPLFLLQARNRKSPSQRKARTAQRGGVCPNTGGCLNLPAEVLLTERETQPSLPPVERQEARIAASKLARLAPRSHSTQNAS